MGPGREAFEEMTKGTTSQGGLPAPSLYPFPAASLLASLPAAPPPCTPSHCTPPCCIPPHCTPSLLQPSLLHPSLHCSLHPSPLHPSLHPSPLHPSLLHPSPLHPSPNPSLLHPSLLLSQLSAPLSIHLAASRFCSLGSRCCLNYGGVRGQGQFPKDKFLQIP